MEYVWIDIYISYFSRDYPFIILIDDVSEEKTYIFLINLSVFSVSIEYTPNDQLSFILT